MWQIRFVRTGDTNSAFVRCFSEVGCERRIGNILGHLQEILFPDCLRDVTELIEFAACTTALIWLQTGDIGFVISTLSGVGTLTIGASWQDGSTLSCSQFRQQFERGYTLRILCSGSVLSVVVLCWFPRLSSWRIIRISSSVITQGRRLPGMWPPVGQYRWAYAISFRCAAQCSGV